MFDAKEEAGFGRILATLEHFVATFEPDAYAASDVPELLSRLARAEKLCGAARLLLTRRAAELSAVVGASDAARFLAGTSGEGVGVARRDLETAGQLASSPELEEALRRGDLSPTQAAALAPALAADPSAAPELLSAAAGEQLRDLRGRCQSVIAASLSQEEAAARAARLEARRHLRFGTTLEGAVSLRGELPPRAGAAVRGALESLAKDVFARARREGRRESHEAYLADALVELCEQGPSSGPRPRPEVVLHVSAEALSRGSLVSGECCEIPGVGPVPLHTAEELLGSALVKVVVRRGVDIASVTHAGRWIPAHLETALQVRDRRCVVPGCGIDYRLERDHVLEWSKGGRTELANLALLCRRHHRLKTLGYFALSGGPGNWAWTSRRPLPPDLEEGFTVHPGAVQRSSATSSGLPGTCSAPTAPPPDVLISAAASPPAEPERVPPVQQSFVCAFGGYAVALRVPQTGGPSFTRSNTSEYGMSGVAGIIDHVAPSFSASANGMAGTVSTAMSKPSSDPPRAPAASVTARSSSANPASMRNNPSYRAARSTGRARGPGRSADRRTPPSAPNQMGTLGCWTGFGRNCTPSARKWCPRCSTRAPDIKLATSSAPSSSSSPRARASTISPKRLSSPEVSTPRPNPSTTRPDERWSRVTTCRTSTWGRLRANGVTIVPIRSREVAVATAARAIHGSATSSGCSGRRRTWSQRKKPSQPRSSAATANLTRR